MKFDTGLLVMVTSLTLGLCLGLTFMVKELKHEVQGQCHIEPKP